MKKRMLALGLALTLTLGLTPAMAAGTADMFPEKNTYTGFRDVAENHWAVDQIKICYETGLMNGKSGGFDPGGTVTAAEAVAVAARVGATLRGDTIPSSTDGTWYGGAVAYLSSLPGGEEIPSGNLEQFNILRQGFFRYLSIALPNDALAAKNTITSLPDTADPDILKFYNAGILTGVNGYGTFAGGRTLIRAEMAVMLSRIVRPETARSFTPKGKDDPNFDPIVYYTGYSGTTPAIVGKDVSVNIADYLTCYIDIAGAYPFSNAEDIRDTTTITCLRNLWQAEHGNDVHPVGDLLAAKHILVETREEADSLRAQLKAAGDSKAKFDELMNLYSKDGRDAQGNLGAPDGYTFGPGYMVAEFENGTKSLKVGEISQPVQSQYGYHIILRTEPDSAQLAEVAYGNWFDAQSFLYSEAFLNIDLPAFSDNYTAALK